MASYKALTIILVIGLLAGCAFARPSRKAENCPIAKVRVSEPGKNLGYVVVNE